MKAMRLSRERMATVRGGSLCAEKDTREDSKNKSRGTE